SPDEEDEQTPSVEFQFESTPAVTTSPPEQLSATELRARYEEVDIDEAVGSLEQVSISSMPQRQGRPVGIRGGVMKRLWGHPLDERGTFGGDSSKVEAHGDVGEPTKKVVAEKPAVEVSPTSSVAKPAFNFGMRAPTPARPPRPPPPAVEDETVVLLPEELSEPIEAVIPPEDLKPVVVGQEAPEEGQKEQEQVNPIGDEAESSHLIISSHGDYIDSLEIKA
ncbi:hypothetical protein Fcan01_21741, partial [Folsomia candida]